MMKNIFFDIHGHTLDSFFTVFVLFLPFLVILVTRDVTRHFDAITICIEMGY